MPSQIREKWLKKYNVTSDSPVSVSSTSEISPIRQKWMKKYNIGQTVESPAEEPKQGFLSSIGNFLSEKFASPVQIPQAKENQAESIDDISQLTPAQRYGEIRQAPALQDENWLEFLGRQLKGSVDRQAEAGRPFRELRRPEIYGRMSEEAKQAEDISRFKDTVAANRASTFTENNPMGKMILGALGRTPEAAVNLAPAFIPGVGQVVLGLQGAQAGLEATPDTEVGPDVLNKVMASAAGGGEAILGAKALGLGTQGKGFLKPFLGTEAAGTALSMAGKDLTPQNLVESAAENVLPSLLFAKMHQKGQQKAQERQVQNLADTFKEIADERIKAQLKEERGKLLRDKVVEGTRPKYFTTETDVEPLSEADLQAPPFQATAKRPPRRTIISSNAEPIVEGEVKIMPEDFGLQSQLEYNASESQKGAKYINKPLTSFIKKRGGLSVNAETLAGQVTGMKGELMQLRDSDPNLVKVRQTPFVTREQSSLSLDRTLEAAIEQGLMPEGSTINDLVQKIDAEQRRTEKLPTNDAAINKMEAERVENETPFPMKDWEASGVNEIQAGVLSKGDKFKTATDTYKVIDDKVVDDRRQITLKDGIEIVVGENDRIPATKYLGKEKAEGVEPQIPFVRPTSEQDIALAKAKEDYDLRMQRAKNLSKYDPVRAGKESKAAGMQYAAEKRKITGNLTAKEQVKLDAKETSNYIGKSVEIVQDGKVVQGKVKNMAFGNVRVELPDGKVVSVLPENVKALPKISNVEIDSPLHAEARKYKTAEEFVQSQIKKDYRSTHQLDLSDSITADKIDIPTLKQKIRERNGYLNKYNLSDLKKLEKLQNNPDADVIIYRASPVNELNEGDWVTTDKIYANDIRKQNGGKVYSYTIKVKDLRFPNDVENLPSLSMASTFSYAPKLSQLTSIWNEANKKPPLEKENPVASQEKPSNEGFFNSEPAPIKSTVDSVMKKAGQSSGQTPPGSKPRKIDEFKSRVYERAQAEHGDILKDNLLYDEQHIKDNIDKAVDLMNTDRTRAYRVAMGVEKAEPYEQAMTNIVMRQKALEDGNNELYIKLIKRGSMEQTKRGQALAMEKASVTDNSPDRYVKELLHAKMNELGSSYLADVADMATEIKGTVQKVFKSGKSTSKESPIQRAQKVIEKETSKALEKIAPNKRIDIQEAQRLIDSLVCK